MGQRTAMLAIELPVRLIYMPGCRGSVAGMPDMVKYSDPVKETHGDMFGVSSEAVRRSMVMSSGVSEKDWVRAPGSVPKATIPCGMVMTMSAKTELSPAFVMASRL